MGTFGGGQTLFPSGGDAVTVHGVEWPVDGEARLTPMEWTFTGTSLILEGRLRRTPFTLTRTISVRGHELTLGETVRSVGGERVETMWGSQRTLGGDLIGPDTVLDTAATVVRPDPAFVPSVSYDDLSPWPRTPGPAGMVNLRPVPGPEAAESRLAYLSELTRPWLRVTRPARGLGLTWSGTAGAGRTCGTASRRVGRAASLVPGGLLPHPDPCSSWPAHGLHEARRVAGSTLGSPAGATRTAYATLTVHPG